MFRARRVETIYLPGYIPSRWEQNHWWDRSWESQYVAGGFITPKPIDSSYVDDWTRQLLEAVKDSPFFDRGWGRD